MLTHLSTVSLCHSLVTSSPVEAVFNRVCPRCKRYPQVQG
jgi:hypothetical protein